LPQSRRREWLTRRAACQQIEFAAPEAQRTPKAYRVHILNRGIDDAWLNGQVRGVETEALNAIAIKFYLRPNVPTGGMETEVEAARARKKRDDGSAFFRLSPTRAAYPHDLTV
jgi:hypothetical protein